MMLPIIFLLAALLSSSSASAAAVVFPRVDGYSNGMLRSAPGIAIPTAANDGFIKPAIVNVAGRSITVPATLRMASNAGQFVKSAMRLNPYLLAGTLAAGYLADHLISVEDGVLVKSVGQQGTFPNGTTYMCTYSCCSGKPCYGSQSMCSLEDALHASGLCSAPDSGSGTISDIVFHDTYVTGRITYLRGPPYNNYNTISANAFPTGNTPPSASYAPVTDADLDALPWPIPEIMPELPSAPYLPSGIPVDPPAYDFAPFDVPVSSPYTRPDGSTAQSMARFSPSGDSVIVDTYDLTLTDSQGNQLANPVPVDTQEPQPDECLLFPDRVGCLPLGPGDDTVMPRETNQFDFAPLPSRINGSCPEPIPLLGRSLSFQPACDAMTIIRPIVIAIASVMASFIFIGALRD